MNSLEGFTSRKLSMKLLPGPSSNANEAPILDQNKKSVRHKFANGIKDHVKGKLSLGAKILQLGGGGMEKVLKQIFSVREGERLLKAFQCCLFTTAGPIAGLVFITTDKLAFCSDRSVVKYTSPTGELLRFHYKVVIPLRKIERANQSESATQKKSSQKYLQVLTTDGFEFWFMGFLKYSKMFKCLQQAISQA